MIGTESIQLLGVLPYRQLTFIKNVLFLFNIAKWSCYNKGAHLLHCDIRQSDITSIRDTVVAGVANLSCSYRNFIHGRRLINIIIPYVNRCNLTVTTSICNDFQIFL